MTLPLFLLISLALAFALETLLWAYAMKHHNAGWVDAGWSGGMFLMALLLPVALGGSPRSLFVAALLLLWSGRLLQHLLRDRLLGGKAEDTRYVALWNHWGEQAKRNYFFFFNGQALLVMIFALPAWAAASRSGPFPAWNDVAGLLVALLAIGGEGLADEQLAAFRAKPENSGSVLDTGLWRYSRHPNYFFEWLHWFAYVILSIGSPLHVVSYMGPVLMYIFLRYLTGIPHAERQSLKRRGEAYRQYQQRTSAFIPWIPQKPS